MNKLCVLSKSISSLLTISLAAALSSTPSAQAATHIWDGGGVEGTDLGTAVNWNDDWTPDVTLGDIALWDGTVAGPLALVYSDAAFAGAPGNPGINLEISGTQTSSLNIDSGIAASALRVNNITIAAGAGAFSLGNSADTFTLTLGGVPGTHSWTNDSSNTAIVASDVRWGLGGSGAHTLAFGGSGNWTMNTVMGVTATGGSGTLALTKNGTGTLTLTEANTYTGGTVLNAGAININNAGALGNTTAGALTINGGTIDNTSGAAVTTTTAKAQNWNGDFTFTGSNNLNFNGGAVTLGGSGSSRTVNVNGGTLTVGSIVGTGYGLTKAGAGTLTAGTAISRITGDLNVTGGTFQIGAQDFIAGGLTGSGTVENGSATARWLFIQNNADNTFSGTLRDGSAGGTVGLHKTGKGTLTLAGTTSYTGRTTVAGGTIEFGLESKEGSAQTFRDVVFDRGDSAIKSSSNGTGSASVTFLAAQSRTPGATANFIVSGGTNGVGNRINLTQAAGFMSQGTFFNGENFAWMDAANTFVRGIAYGTDLGAVTSGTTATLAAATHQEFTGNITGQTSATFTTLKNSGNNALTLAPGATVTVNGLLKTGNVAGGATISGGNGIQAANNTELVIRTDRSNDSLTISTPILANGTSSLTKSGAGTLTLSGASTYTGATTVAGGTLNLTGSIAGGSTITVDGGALNISGSAGAGTSQLTVSGLAGGVLNILPGASISRNNLFVGTGHNAAAGAGAVYQTGGALTLVAAANVNNFQLGAGVNGSGYYKLSGGTLTLNEMGIGGAANANTIGVMDVTNGGSVANGGWITLGRGSGLSSGLLNLDGGTITASRLDMNWGNAAGAQSVVNIKNGSISVNGSATTGLNLANTSNVAGVLGVANLMSGGTLNTGLVTAGQGNATTLLNFHGGTLKATATNAGASFLTSGNVDGVFVYGGGGTIDNSGTNITISRPLQAPTGDGISSIAVSGGAGYVGAPMVMISGGGGTGATGSAQIDANGNLTGITITNPGTGYTSAPVVTLVGGGGSGATIGTISTAANTGGGLTFAGTGTTTLTGANTFSGASSISAGTVLLGTGGSLNGSSGITVSGGAKLVQTNLATAVIPAVSLTNGTLDGTGMFDKVTVGDSTANVINYGNGTTAPLTIGSLTFNGAATMNFKTSTLLQATPGVLTFDLNTGAVNTGGKVIVNVTNPDPWNTGDYSLMSYATLGGSGLSSFQKGTITGLGARQSATITDLFGVIALTIAGDFPVWTGQENSNWTTSTVGGQSNWKLQTEGTATDFLTGDIVRFDDTATGSTAVDISNGNVSPTGTTFNNSNLNYTLSSSGGFGIANGSLVKSGSGSVTITTANTYAGGTTLNEGTININNAAALGTGTFTVNNGTIDNTSGSSITLSGNNAQTWGNFGYLSFMGTNALNLGTGAVALGSDATAGTFTIVNNGTLPSSTLTIGGAITSGTGGTAGAKTLNIEGSGNTVLSGNITRGAATALVINNNLAGTLTLSGAESSITTLNMNGGASSALDLGAGSLTVANGGGNILQSLTGGTINATGGGTLVIGSANGDFGTAAGTTLTVNANISGTNAIDFYSANGALGTIVLAGANTHTGAVQVENTRLIVPTGGAINSLNTANSGQLNVGTFNGSIAVLDLDGGTINATKTASPSAVIGNATGATGAMNVTSGTFNTTSELWVGSAAGAYGAFTQSGGTVNVGNWLPVGRNGSGYLHTSGGTLNVASQNFTIGSFTGTNGTLASSFGVVNLTGNSVVNVASTAANQGRFIVAEAGMGQLNVSGNAALNIAGAGGLNFASGATAPGAGTGTGIANLNGGTVTTPIVQKGTGTGTGTLNFDGGTLKASAATASFMEGLTAVYVNDGGAIIDDGGFSIIVAQPLLAPTGSGISSISVAESSGYIGTPLVEITGDGTGATAIANIDETGNLTGITITNPGVNYTNAIVTLIGGGSSTFVNEVTFAENTSGGFTKKGSGTLTLGGANTYTGPTVIEAGTLALTGSIRGSTSITAKSGTTFNVSGVTGGFSLANGQTLAGNGSVTGNIAMSAGSKLAPGETLGSLAFNGTLDISLAVTPTDSKALLFELGSSTNSDKAVFASGALHIGTGVLAFDDFAFTTLGGLTQDTYTLFDGNSPIVGMLDANVANLTGSLGGGFTGTIGFADGGNDLVLSVVPEPSALVSLLGGLGTLLGTRRFRRRSH